MEKYFNWIIGIAVFAAAIVVGVHFIHAYDRLNAERPEVTVTIPEGSTMYDIDRILAANGVLARGVFVAAAQAYSTANDFTAGATASSTGMPLEGMLFPDTYDFYVSSTASGVIQKFLNNFNVKAAPLFADAAQGATNTLTGASVASMTIIERDLVIASMVQKEVASSTDMAIVAGILEKRLAAGDYLNVDATICYAKEVANPTSTAGCYPITVADLANDSPYNTYLHKGLPPTPIGNPGAAAIEATLHPESSTYWYYLSDPKTGATIYAVTLAEQEANQRIYLAP